MNEHEWDGLKRYLEEHGIEYELNMTFMSGFMQAYSISLPWVIIEGSEETK